MSASLVGSEMCIRDRIYAFEDEGDLGERLEGMRRRAQQLSAVFGAEDDDPLDQREWYYTAAAHPESPLGSPVPADVVADGSRFQRLQDAAV
eukprot:6496431-Alexandrium_andersonii.AAC.1